MQIRGDYGAGLLQGCLEMCVAHDPGAYVYLLEFSLSQEWHFFTCIICNEELMGFIAEWPRSRMAYWLPFLEMRRCKHSLILFVE
jgi:hypothetical protein